MIHGTWKQLCHQMFVGQLLSVLKSERRSFVLNSRNTDEHYGGCNLLQNTDLSQRVVNTESGCPVVLLFVVFVSRGITSHGDRRLSVYFKI